jgi:ribonuclease P protein component
MFAKANRLKKTADFKKIFRDGQLIRGDLAEVRFLPNGLEICRFGFITSLKISKKATVRNRVKRLLSEVTRPLSSSINNGLDVLIVAKVKIVGKNQKEIKDDVENLFKKAEIFS